MIKRADYTFLYNPPLVKAGTSVWIIQVFTYRKITFNLPFSLKCFYIFFIYFNLLNLGNCINVFTS